jgi:hypothetical protein
MGAKIQAFDIFQTPLSSHYPQPLNKLGIRVGQGVRRGQELALLFTVA